jgi:DNA-binding NarL/FixJ family response regulator
MDTQVTRTDPQVKVLLVDDHPTFCEGLRSLLGYLDGFTVCAAVDGESSAMRSLAANLPDMMIVDLNLKDGSGLKLIHRARQSYPALRILVASMYDESLYGERSIRAGANGYICKQDDPEHMARAVSLVSRGEMFISRKLTNRMLEQKLSGNVFELIEPKDILSDRELQVFSLIGTGLSTKEIADRLHLSSKTIDTHRDHIKKKMGISDNSRLVHRAVEWTLLQQA